MKLLILASLLAITSFAQTAKRIAVIAETKSSSDCFPYLQVKIKNDGWQEVQFTDLPGRQMISGKGDWWEFSISDFTDVSKDKATSTFKLNHIKKFRIRSECEDAWKIQHISVLVEDNSDVWRVAAFEEKFQKWTGSNYGTVNIPILDNWRDCNTDDSDTLTDIHVFAASETGHSKLPYFNVGFEKNIEIPACTWTDLAVIISNKNAQFKKIFGESQAGDPVTLSQFEIGGPAVEMWKINGIIECVQPDGRRNLFWSADHWDWFVDGFSGMGNWFDDGWGEFEDWVEDTWQDLMCDMGAAGTGDKLFSEILKEQGQQIKKLPEGVQNVWQVLQRRQEKPHKEWASIFMALMGDHLIEGPLCKNAEDYIEKYLEKVQCIIEDVDIIDFDRANQLCALYCEFQGQDLVTFDSCTCNADASGTIDRGCGQTTSKRAKANIETSGGGPEYVRLELDEDENVMTEKKTNWWSMKYERASSASQIKSFNVLYDSGDNAWNPDKMAVIAQMGDRYQVISYDTSVPKVNREDVKGESLQLNICPQRRLLSLEA